MHPPEKHIKMDDRSDCRKEQTQDLFLFVNQEDNTRYQKIGSRAMNKPGEMKTIGSACPVRQNESTENKQRQPPRQCIGMPAAKDCHGS